MRGCCTSAVTTATTGPFFENWGFYRLEGYFLVATTSGPNQGYFSLVLDAVSPDGPRARPVTSGCAVTGWCRLGQAVRCPGRRCTW
jgi:hypothetical protein